MTAMAIKIFLRQLPSKGQINALLRFFVSCVTNASEFGLVVSGDILDGLFITRPLDEIFDESEQAEKVCPCILLVWFKDEFVLDAR